MAYRSTDRNTIPLTIWLRKKPATDKEETRQTKQEKHIVITHPFIAQAIIANMGKDNENHRRPTHRVNIFYPLFCHYKCKSKEKSCKSWLFHRKMLLLHYERAYPLDRLGKGTGCDLCRVLPPATIAGVVLLPLSPICDYRYFLLPLRLLEERSWELERQLAEVLARTRYSIPALLSDRLSLLVV